MSWIEQKMETSKSVRGNIVAKEITADFKLASSPCPISGSSNTESHSSRVQFRSALAIKWKLAVRAGVALIDYELDHVIPLELGGAPLDERNLELELLAGACGAPAKNKLECECHDWFVRAS
jgi:hypothetical protein